MNSRGFTLLELVVALTIFAVMATIAYSGLAASLFARSTLEQESRQWQSLQLAISRLDRDLRYLAERDVRDENAALQPALLGQAHWMELTLAGRANPAKLPRASLQRVRLQWSNRAVTRLAWPVLDRARGIQPEVSDLLESVSRIEFRYLKDGQWLDQWPPEESGESPLPQAISVVLDHEIAGRIERLYQVASRRPAS